MGFVCRIGVLVVIVLLCGAGPSNAVVNTFLIPHSHCDVGWIQTPNSYYELNVTRILDGVVEALRSTPAFKFTWAETFFFAKWWSQQSTGVQQAVRDLAQSGQLEFVGGGWVQHDENTPTPLSVLQQMTVGHQFLLDNVGVRPKVGWQIDIFGSTANTPTFFSGMGFDAMVTTRVEDYRLDARRSSRTLEFVWQGSSSLSPEASGLFTHIFADYYCWPLGNTFNWGGDWPGGPHAPYLSEDNMGTIATQFAAYLHSASDQYRSNNMIVPWGCDFQWQSTPVMLQNTTALIEHMNANPSKYGVHIQYATPSDYFDSLYALNQSWPTFVHDDFLPYIIETKSGWIGEWTGFLTSRPTLKADSRHTHAMLRAGSIALSLATSAAAAVGDTSPLPATLAQSVQLAKRNASVVLHHDAITGTSCAPSEGCHSDLGGDHNVVSAYFSRLADAQSKLTTVLQASLTALTQGGSWPKEGAETLLLSDTTDAQLRLKSLVSGAIAVTPLVLYNPLAWASDRVVRIRVPGTAEQVARVVSVVDVGLNVTLTAQTVDPVTSPQDTTMPWCWMYFVPRVPALGWATYDVRSDRRGSGTVASKVEPAAGVVNVTLYGLPGDAYVMQLDTATALPSAVIRPNGDRHRLQVHPFFYTSQNDDPYTFRASYPGQQPLVARVKDAHMARGPLLTEVRVPFDSPVAWMDAANVQWVTRVFGSNDGQPSVLPEWQLLQVQVEVGIGPMANNQELVVSVQSDVHNGGSKVMHDRDGEPQSPQQQQQRQQSVDEAHQQQQQQQQSPPHGGVEGPIMWTDDGGYETMRRSFNTSRPNISGNYYPMVYSAFINDTETCLAVVSDRTRGISTNSGVGHLEFMLHRRSIYHDISLAVIGNDTSWADAQFTLFVGEAQAMNRYRHIASMRMDNPLSAFVGPLQRSSATFPVPTNSALMVPLPQNVHLLTLEPVTASPAASSRLRLQHLYEASEDVELSESVVISLRSMFTSPFNFTSAEEMSLTFNQPLSSAQHAHRQWSVDTSDVKSQQCRGNSEVVTLKASEIRAWLGHA